MAEKQQAKPSRARRVGRAIYEFAKGVVKGVAAIYLPIIYVPAQVILGAYDLYNHRGKQGAYNVGKGLLDIPSVDWIRGLLGLYEVGAGLYRAGRAARGEDATYKGIKM